MSSICIRGRGSVPSRDTVLMVSPCCETAILEPSGDQAARVADPPRSRNRRPLPSAVHHVHPVSDEEDLGPVGRPGNLDRWAQTDRQARCARPPAGLCRPGLAAYSTASSPSTRGEGQLASVQRPLRAAPSSPYSWIAAPLWSTPPRLHRWCRARGRRSHAHPSKAMNARRWPSGDQTGACSATLVVGIEPPQLARLHRHDGQLGCRESPRGL